MKDFLKKIKSVKLCLMAHPDNQVNSEFADRISDLEEIENKLANYWTKSESHHQLGQLEKYKWFRLLDASTGVDWFARKGNSGFFPNQQYITHYHELDEIIYPPK